MADNPPRWPASSLHLVMCPSINWILQTPSDVLLLGCPLPLAWPNSYLASWKPRLKLWVSGTWPGSLGAGSSFGGTCLRPAREFSAHTTTILGPKPRPICRPSLCPAAFPVSERSAACDSTPQAPPPRAAPPHDPPGPGDEELRLRHFWRHFRLQDSDVLHAFVHRRRPSGKRFGYLEIVIYASFDFWELYKRFAASCSSSPCFRRGLRGCFSNRAFSAFLRIGCEACGNL